MILKMRTKFNVYIKRKDWLRKILLSIYINIIVKLIKSNMYEVLYQIYYDLYRCSFIRGLQGIDVSVRNKNKNINYKSSLQKISSDYDGLHIYTYVI